MAAKIHVVLSAWKNFDLPGTQHMLDETAAGITKNQDESDISRKKLVDMLKNFRQNSSEDSRAEAGPVIKGFQNEVDQLSKKRKYAEAAFLKCYQKLLDIVDPTPSLEYCKSVQNKVDKMNDLELENKSLHDTLKDFNEEFKDIKNQDVTIKNLREKLKSLECEMDVKVLQQVSSKERILLNEIQSKEQLLDTEAKAISDKLKDMESSKNALQHQLEEAHSEIFELKAKYDDVNAGKLEEINILTNDLDRVNQLYSTLIKEIDSLKNSTKKCQNCDNSSDNLRDVELNTMENEIKRKDSEITQLMQNIKRLQEELEISKKIYTDQISGVQVKLLNQEEELSQTFKKLQNQTDYDEIKRELGVIKMIEFGTLSSNLKENEVPTKPLELLLLEKNKVLQSDNTSLKQELNVLRERVTILDKENQEFLTQNTYQANLISQLEADVSSINSVSIQHSSVEETQASLLSRALSDSHESNESFQNNDKSDILSIVSAQRERFKSKNATLENEVIEKTNSIMRLQGEIDSLRADNVKLYEKIRFLQSFDHRKSSVESYTESQYSSQYESGLDPFSTFSQRERQRKYAALSPFEKITLFIGKFILQNKTARTFALIYFVFVHCLIFFALFLMANTESCKRDISTKCSEMFMEHMHDVHGNKDFKIE